MAPWKNLMTIFSDLYSTPERIEALALLLHDDYIESGGQYPFEKAHDLMYARANQYLNYAIKYKDIFLEAILMHDDFDLKEFTEGLIKIVYGEYAATTMLYMGKTLLNES